jgi:hypothetical protein
MCQMCVDDGHLTAAELVQRMAQGDRSVIAMQALEPDEFLGTVAEVAVGAVTDGMDATKALEMALRCIRDYLRARPEQADRVNTRTFRVALQKLAR